MSRVIASAIRLRQATDAWAPVELADTGILPTLHQQGIAKLAGFPGQDVAARLLHYFLGKPVLGRDGRLVPLDRLPADTMAAAYPLRTILECPDMLPLLNAAPVLRIAADYLNCKPTLSSLGVRWSFPGGDPAADTQKFHRDPDDWRFLKLFIYLTDVDEGAGPHSYVMQSHLTAGQARARPYSQVEIEGRYGSDRVCTITGPSGTAFMADTYGIHAGMVPTHTPRLMLSAQYSLLPVFAFRYEPLVVQHPPGLDPYVNRLLVGGRNAVGEPG